MAIEGGCLCGAVRYAINGTLGSADHCHCSMCRRQHGAAFATYADVNPYDFAWTTGADNTRVFAVPSGDGWCFCQHCGSTLAGTQNGNITSVALGTVDTDPEVTASSHIFVGSKASWYEITDDLPQWNERAADSDSVS